MIQLKRKIKQFQCINHFQNIVYEEIEEFFEGEIVDIEVKVLKTASMKKFNCNFLIIDEAHTVCSAQLRNIFENCNPTFILGLTATYERLDGQEKEVLDK